MLTKSYCPDLFRSGFGKLTCQHFFSRNQRNFLRFPTSPTSKASAIKMQSQKFITLCNFQLIVPDKCTNQVVHTIYTERSSACTFRFTYNCHNLSAANGMMVELRFHRFSLALALALVENDKYVPGYFGNFIFCFFIALLHFDRSFINMIVVIL